MHLSAVSNQYLTDDHSDQRQWTTDSEAFKFLSLSFLPFTFVLVNHVWLLTEMSTLFINAPIFQPKH